MFKIEQVTDYPLQTQTIVIPDGSSFQITIRFVSMQFGWFINRISYGTFELNGLRITNSPNMLYQFQNQIPFGLACFSQSSREPSLAQDFLTEYSELYVLDQADVELYQGILNGKVPT